MEAENNELLGIELALENDSLNSVLSKLAELVGEKLNYGLFQAENLADNCKSGNFQNYNYYIYSIKNTLDKAVFELNQLESILLGLKQHKSSEGESEV